MDYKELAKLLDGREYWKEMTAMEESQAKGYWIVVVYWYGDDLCVLKWAKDDDELYLSEGEGEFYLNQQHILFPCEDTDCPYHFEACENANRLEVYSNNDVFKYHIDVPYATFNIMEWESVYCVWITFNQKDLKKANK